MRWKGAVAGLAVAVAAATGQAGAVRPEPMIRAIVVLDDQVDPGSVREPDHDLRRAALERELRARASAGQRELLELLRALRSRGLVSAVRPLWIVNAVAVTAAPSALPELAALPEVGEIRPDLAVPAPRLVKSAGQAEPNLALVNAPGLWSLGHRGRGVVVASLDTGVDVTHPDLASRYRGGANSWYDPNGEHPGGPVDVSGHGTATMGIMVGGDAGGTAVGVAPDATWIAAKIFNDRGVATLSGVHLAMQWLLDPDGDPETDDAPDVVNNSWTGGEGGCDLEFQPDLGALRAVGILPVFAAGNQGPLAGSVRSPADNPEAFTVGATDAADAVDPSSGRGPSACAGAIAPRMVAPGVDVRTTDLYGLYTTASGTSLAAPHVAGALALLLGAYPGLDAGRQEAALLHGALDLGVPGQDDESGYGRLDVLAAHRWLATAPDFTVAATPGSRLVTTGGGTARYTVTVGAMNGFAGPVAFSVWGLPPGADATWEPPEVTGAGGSRLTVSIPGGTAPGAYPLTISGSDGPLTHSVQVTLVVGAGDFALTVSPPVLSAARGGSAVSTVSLPVSGGFAGNVTLKVTGLPMGTMVSLSPNPAGAPGTSRLTVRTTSSTPRGTFALRITGTHGPLTHGVAISLAVR
ncbi:S8 family serine peptidase [Streptosporangium sp. NPDC051023]|uniref:S8 family serine peptidase n=1 Tax=Streptosporangium sp. NPDC051023 TaxID=3155410 RepID=UPI00344E461E